MKFQIKNRWSAAVQFECELTAEIAGERYGVQLGFAVRKARESDAVLRGAVLSGAVLSGADPWRGPEWRGPEWRGPEWRGPAWRGPECAVLVART
jgi:uncharacterized protein YjbI with pentapeptide repeats